MPLELGRVDRLLQAPQQAEVDRVRLGLVGRLGQDLLEVEPRLRVLDLQAEAAGELGEVLELPRLGVGVGAAEEADAPLRQVRRDGLVGREHELLDHLVALVVRGQMCPDDLALLPQVDLDLGHVQLEGTAGEPAAAEDHRQLVHLLIKARSSGPTPSIGASGSFNNVITCS